MENNYPLSIEELEQIENYLNAALSPADAEAFRKRLQNEPPLQQKLEQIKLLVLGIKEAALKDQLNGFHKPFTGPVVTIKKGDRNNKKYWLVAASVAIIVAVGALLLADQKNSNEKLFARYFTADPGLVTSMGTTDKYDFDRAMIDYKTGKYKEALAGWNKLLLSKPGNDTLTYFSGVTQLALNNTNEAITSFTQTIHQPNSVFRSDAYWYLALALVKNDRAAEAINYLQQTNHSNKEELLHTLKNEPD